VEILSTAAGSQREHVSFDAPEDALVQWKAGGRGRTLWMNF